MSVYPMNIETESLSHKGGTKAYHFMIITNAKGNAVLVNRWGKTGAFGQFKVEQFDSYKDASAARNKKRNEKRGGGYAPAASDMKTVHSEADLRAVLGIGYIAQFGGDNLLHIDPDFNVTGIKSSKPDYDEEGRKIDNAKRVDAALLEAARQREAEEARLREQEAYRNNPMFGLF